MKKINKIIALLLLACPVLFSCERDLETEGVSKVITLPPVPEITLNGDEVMSVEIGGSYTEPGATATEGGVIATSSKYTPYITPGEADPSLFKYGLKTKSVNTNVPGMYVITYQATNTGGTTTAARYLFVLPKAVNPAIDLSGNYTSTTSPAATVTRVAPGVYYSTNAWGGGSTVVIPAYLVSPDGVDINVPYQESLVPIYGYGKRLANGNLDLLMTRPTFATPLFDVPKLWVKQ